MAKKKSKSHVKPTKEELDAKAQAAIDAKPPKEPDKPAPEPAPSEPESPAPELEPQADPSEEAKTKLKKKLSASARENQKILAKNRVIDKALVDADEAPEPTEKELQEEFTDWEVMSETERKLAKETVVSRRWRDTISKAKEQAKKIVKWNDSVKTFVGNPQTLIDNPELEGETEEFEVFATEEENSGAPFKVLVGAFLHGQSTGKTKNKGKMFETGSGGPSEKPQPKSDKISLEDARKLKKVDYRKYKEKLKAGKIDLDI